MFSQYTWPELNAGPSELTLLAERTALLHVQSPDTLHAKPNVHQTSVLVPPLPIELVRKILEERVLFGDADWVKDMQSCSLVCSDWLPETRTHLFRTIVVTDKHHTRNIDRFIGLLTQSPEIYKWIRILSFQAPYSQAGPSTPITSSLVAFILDRLLLTCLEIDGLRFDTTLVKWYPAPDVPSYTIDRLRIINQRAWTSISQDLLDVLGLFSAVKEFTLDTVGELKDSVCADDGTGSGFTEEMMSALQMGNPCAVKALNLHSVAQLHFYLEVLKRKRSMANLQTLSVSCGNPVHISAFARDLGAFLASDVAHIHQLSLELAGCFRNRLDIQVAEDLTKLSGLLLPGLSHMSSLNVFGLLILLPPGQGLPYLMWQLLVSVLLSLPRTVERIQICFQLDVHARPAPEDAMFDWDAPWTAPQLDWWLLRNALTNFPRLEVLQLGKSYSLKNQHELTELSPEEKWWIGSRLPELITNHVLLLDPI